MRWCCTAASSSELGTAVPMCISLKNCRESQEMISVLSFWAIFIPKAVLPMAVGPSITQSVLVFVELIELFKFVEVV